VGAVAERQDIPLYFRQTPLFRPPLTRRIPIFESENLSLCEKICYTGMCLSRRGGYNFMSQITDVERMLHRARLLVGEGQDDLALASLETIHTDNEEQQQEIAYLRGLVYLLAGKESQAKAKQAEGEQQRKLLEEAISWFEKAQKQFSLTQERVSVAEMYSSWAEALEELGHMHEALACLKSAYEALSS
jgi:tetratricopeptide (TPR) repeat protein